MARKWKHSLAGLALVSATVAAPASVSTAGAQGGWAGFTATATSTVVNLEDGAQSPAFGAATTEDLGGAGVDLWVNNHALLSEALVDWTGPGAFAGSATATGDPADSHGSYFGDLDGDGDDDLIETAGRDSINRVFLNNNGTLELQENTGIETLDARSRGALLVDIEGDGDLDVLVGNLDRTVVAVPEGEPPLDAAPSALYLNDGTGTTFTEVDDVNNAIEDGNLRYLSLTSTGPGTDQVIITSNAFSFGINTLRTGTATPTAALNPVRQSLGVDDNLTNARDFALGDLDGDLDIEFVVARQQDRLGQDGAGDQIDPSLEGQLPLGIGQVGFGGANTLEIVQDISSSALVDNCRSIALADFDNDADLDIFGGCTLEQNGQDTNVVLLNDGDGNFTVNDSLVPTTGSGTAAVVITADVNNDGWVDTYVGNGFDDSIAPNNIFMNNGGNGNHWLQIDLDNAGTDVPGAQVFVGTDIWQVRESGHRNHRGQDMSTLHFGLGSQDEIAPIEIQWPDGTFETCTVSGVDQRVTITQGSADCVAQTESGLVAAVDAAPQIPMAPVEMCASQVVTVNIGLGDSPTEGPDVILGTPGDDVIDGLGGSDTICALGGDDVIDGGRGNDTIFAGGGVDDVDGGRGNDTINGGSGGDELDGGIGDDVIHGGNGADTIRGGGGDDVLNGNKKNDTLFGQGGADRINGNSGKADVLIGGSGVDRFNGGKGSGDDCSASAASETRVNCEIL